MLSSSFVNDFRPCIKVVALVLSVNDCRPSLKLRGEQRAALPQGVNANELNVKLVFVPLPEVKPIENSDLPPVDCPHRGNSMKNTLERFERLDRFWIPNSTQSAYPWYGRMSSLCGARKPVLSKRGSAFIAQIAHSSLFLLVESKSSSPQEVAASANGAEKQDQAIGTS